MSKEAELGARERLSGKAADATDANIKRENEIKRAGQKIQTLSDAELTKLYGARADEARAIEMRNALETAPVAIAPQLATWIQHVCGGTSDATGEPSKWALAAAKSVGGLSFMGLGIEGFGDNDPALDPRVVMKAVLDGNVEQNPKAKEHWKTAREWIQGEGNAQYENEDDNKQSAALSKLTTDENWQSCQQEVARLWNGHLSHMLNSRFPATVG